MASDNSTRIVAIANQKGGVGKTTTAINLSAALADKGHKVLLIDLDPQGNASSGLGIGIEQRKLTSFDIVVEGRPVKDAILSTNIKNLDIVPSTTDLSSADVEIMDESNRVIRLKQAFAELEGYKYVFIDCPPSLNLLTLNALASAESVLVPLQSEFFALEGLSQLLLTIREVREAMGNKLRVEGVVLTMFDRRNKLSHQIELDARENLGDLVYETIIPRSVRLSEAPSFGEAVIHYDNAGAGAQAYLSLAAEFLKRDKTRK